MQVLNQKQLTVSKQKVGHCDLIMLQIFVAPTLASWITGVQFSICQSILSVHNFCRHWLLSNSNDLFSEIIAPMNLKFHMRHNQTAGLQTGKIQPGQESPKLPQILKIAKLLKSIFSPEWPGIFGWNFVWSICGILVSVISKWKKSVAK